jgi:hypothetical protein
LHNHDHHHPHAMSTPPRPAPARTPSYLYFVPRRSPAALRASYDNLVALANAQERLRGTVWRDRGEPVTELESVDECVLHAARGGLRECRGTGTMEDS